MARTNWRQLHRLLNPPNPPFPLLVFVASQNEARRAHRAAVSPKQRMPKGKRPRQAGGNRALTEEAFQLRREPIARSCNSASQNDRRWREQVHQRNEPIGQVR